ncbi:MAG TPA: LysM peptidoglycan-binding domain-containing protein [Chryseolinea sp.]
MINVLVFSSVLFFNAYQVHRDSIGTETVNGKVFVIHSVGEKETLYGISRRYGASIESILQYNPTADAGLEIGQILKIPYTQKRSTRANTGTTHTVAAKETMFSISKMYGVTVDEIKQWNNLSDNNLSIGQQLVVKKGTSVSSSSSQASTTTSPASVTNKKGVHTVAAKETMFSISRQYGITVQQLQAWNNLTGNEISIGQELVVAPPTGEVVKQSAPAAENTPPAQATPAVTQTTPSVPVVVEQKKDVPVQAAPQSKTEPKEQTIRISESVKNSDEVLQTGLAELIDGTSGNRKYLALHRSAPVGTIMKVRNEMNNREVFVRVMGKLPDTALNDKLVIKISKSAYDRLGAIDPRFRVEVTYYK